MEVVVAKQRRKQLASHPQSEYVSDLCFTILGHAAGPSGQSDQWSWLQAVW